VSKKKKFSSKDFLSQFETCPQLAYDFSKDEILVETKRFLEFIGYKIVDPPGMDQLELKPNFYGIREVQDKKFKIAGLLIKDMTEATETIAPLDTLKSQLGEDVDFVMAVPPVNERYLIDFMCEDNYRLYKKIQQERYMLWLINPDELSVWCAFGAPRDKFIQEYFKFQGGIDRLMQMPYRREAKQIRKDFWKDEE